MPNTHDGHKCRRLHGHTYDVEIQVTGTPDPVTGWLIDYAEIAAAWAPLHERLDHRCLNDISGLENPTTEVLAPWILRQLTDQRVTAVRVYESSTTWCEVRR